MTAESLATVAGPCSTARLTHAALPQAAVLKRSTLPAAQPPPQPRAGMLKYGAAVLYGKYLIGVIKKAYPTYSVVNTILDPDFSVSAYDISTNELSFVSGDANLAKQGVCKFENLSSSSKISYGSIIATAGISKKMPKGIIIGTVKDINNDDTDISSYAAVEPGTDIEKVTSVLILTNYSESEGK
jgi:rod shape-determining protein MreC